MILVDPEFEKKAQTWKMIFSRQLSSKVNVHFSPEGKGKIDVHFESVEEADWLMEHLRVEE